MINVYSIVSQFQIPGKLFFKKAVVYFELLLTQIHSVEESSQIGCGRTKIFLELSKMPGCLLFTLEWMPQQLIDILYKLNNEMYKHILNWPCTLDEMRPTHSYEQLNLAALVVWFLSTRSVSRACDTTLIVCAGN